MRAPEAGGLDADRLAGLVDLDTERGDRLARRLQPVPVRGGSDEHLGQVDEAEQPGRLPPLAATEERAGVGVARVGAVKRSDRDVGAEDDPHRSASSRSSRSR